MLNSIQQFNASPVHVLGALPSENSKQLQFTKGIPYHNGKQNKPLMQAIEEKEEKVKHYFQK